MFQFHIYCVKRQLMLLLCSIEAGHYDPNIAQYRHAMREVYKLNNIRETKEHIDCLIRKSLEFQKRIGLTVDESLYNEFVSRSTSPLPEELSTIQTSSLQSNNEGQKSHPNQTVYNLRQKQQNGLSQLYPDEETEFMDSTDDETETNTISKNIQNIDREIKLIELQKRLLVFHFKTTTSLSQSLCIVIFVTIDN